MYDLIKKYGQGIYLALLLLVAGVVYLTQYGHPKALFWDENYHIASAQKYIDGVMFMEPHPPLGKMLMAVSEVGLGANSEKDKSRFDKTDYVRDPDLPKGGISYYGFRLPSTLLMTLSILFFYGIVRRITGNCHIAAAFSAFMIFDNALVVHARSAMLEGIQLFFILAAIYYAVRSMTENKPIRLSRYALLGVLIGLAVSVKINAAVLLLLFVFLFGRDQWPAIKNWRWMALIKRLAITVPAGVIPLIFTFLAVFYLHIGLGSTLASHSSYKASESYQAAVKAGDSWAPTTFITGFKDNWRFMSEYADGVPRLDVCKPGENGSSALGWPLGTKTISYRWSKDTIDGVTRVRYHTLVVNPVIWFSVALGIILSVGLILSRFVYGNPIKDKPLFYWISAFTTLYISYMIAILQIERVMYLYHYLVPLIFGLINLALIFTYIFRLEINTGSRHFYINLVGLVALVIAVFIVFAPFTYSWELTETGFNARNWFDYWKLELVR